MQQIIVFFVCLMPLAGMAQMTVTDAQGTQLVLKEPAKRVISLAPHITEQVFAAGAGETLIAVSSYSDYPPAAQDLPEVGDAFRVDIEQIVALKPDLVLAWASGTPDAAVSQMRALGLKVAVLEPHSLQDIATTLEKIGRWTGRQGSAQKAAKAFLKRLAQLHDNYADAEPVRVFFEISSRPLYTINGQHTISAVLELCGGVNVFANLNTLAPAVSIEAVLNRNPQAIIGTGEGQAATQDMLRWLRWKSLAAVKATNLFLIPPAYISRATPRLLNGAKMICTDLQEARERLGKE